MCAIVSGEFKKITCAIKAAALICQSLSFGTQYLLPTKGPAQYIQWLSQQVPLMIAGPKLLAGFMLAPVNGIPTVCRIKIVIPTSISVNSVRKRTTSNIKLYQQKESIFQDHIRFLLQKEVPIFLQKGWPTSQKQSY
jgi:hypothetical protein